MVIFDILHKCRIIILTVCSSFRVLPVLEYQKFIDCGERMV